MSISRQRMIDTFAFNHPDKIPVIYNVTWPSGLHRHGQKMIDLYREYPPDNPFTVSEIPAPPPSTIQPDGKYHELKTDEWGTTWEYLIFGIAGHPKSYPFKSWKEARDYKFPPLPASDPLTREKNKNYLTIGCWISIFEKLSAFRPIDEVFMDILDADEDLLDFLDRLVDYWGKVIQIVMDDGLDVIMFGDDWGTQSASIVSPELFRRLFKPRYQKLMGPIKKAGRRIFFHSCGQLGELFDELLDLGINGLWPQITLHESTPHQLAACIANKVTVYLHPDRQKLIPFGTPAEIDAKVRGYCELYKKVGGGAIFHVEMENDSPWENVEALVKAIDQYR